MRSIWVLLIGLVWMNMVSSGFGQKVIKAGFNLVYSSASKSDNVDVGDTDLDVDGSLNVVGDGLASIAFARKKATSAPTMGAMEDDEVPDEVQLDIDLTDSLKDGKLNLMFQRQGSVFTQNVYDRLPESIRSKSTQQVSYKCTNGHGTLTFSVPQSQNMSEFGKIQNPKFYGMFMNDEALVQFRTVATVDENDSLEVELNPDAGICGGEILPESEMRQLSDTGRKMNELKKSLRGMSGIIRARAMQASEVWPDCYPGEENLQTLKIGIAVSSRLVNSWGSENVLDKITEYVTSANIVYVTQLNVQLLVDDLDFTYTADTTYCQTITNVLGSFRAHTKPSTQGIWHVIEDCLPYVQTTPGYGVVVGVAYIGTFCVNSVNIGVTYEHGSGTWLTLAHEIGHNFNATHSFENGVGTTGGIMDYGNGKYDGVYQFNPLRKEEICNKIKNAGRDFSCNSFSLEICEDQDAAYCSAYSNYCSYSSIQNYCPETCGLCRGTGDYIPQTLLPTKSPTHFPTVYPTKFPTDRPSTSPTTFPTDFPSVSPTRFPTSYPTEFPSPAPSSYPSKFPTTFPTHFPTVFPSVSPTSYPTSFPSSFPTKFPTTFPSLFPTQFPSSYPTSYPTSFPSKKKL